MSDAQNRLSSLGLIETLWNVNDEDGTFAVSIPGGLIETLWNVNLALLNGRDTASVV